jgi:hypothetical protein
MSARPLSNYSRRFFTDCLVSFSRHQLPRADDISGWFNLFQSGTLHRDKSIGNVLRLDTPALRKPFHFRRLNEISTSTPPEDAETSGEAASSDKGAASIGTYAESGEGAVQEVTPKEEGNAGASSSDPGSDLYQQVQGMSLKDEDILLEQKVLVCSTLTCSDPYSLVDLRYSEFTQTDGCRGPNARVCHGL